MQAVLVLVIDGSRVDVVSHGGFIEAGAAAEAVCQSGAALRPPLDHRQPVSATLGSPTG